MESLNRKCVMSRLEKFKSNAKNIVLECLAGVTMFVASGCNKNNDPKPVDTKPPVVIVTQDPEKKPVITEIYPSDIHSELSADFVNDTLQYEATSVVVDGASLVTRQGQKKVHTSFEKMDQFEVVGNGDSDSDFVIKNMGKDAAVYKVWSATTGMKVPFKGTDSDTIKVIIESGKTITLKGGATVGFSESFKKGQVALAHDRLRVY